MSGDNADRAVGGGRLAPIGPELTMRNRRILAERLGWPEGALGVCQEIERARPDWSVNWSAGNEIRNFESPPGYYAVHPRASYGEPAAYGADAKALLKAIDARSSFCPRCGARQSVPAGTDCPPHKEPESGAWCRSSDETTMEWEMSGGEHPASRPSWDCAQCGQPWPCDPAREQLASEMTRSELAGMMAVRMVIAARENLELRASELKERFLAWTR